MNTRTLSLALALLSACQSPTLPQDASLPPIDTSVLVDAGDAQAPTPDATVPVQDAAVPAQDAALPNCSATVLCWQRVASPVPARDILGAWMESPNLGYLVSHNKAFEWNGSDWRELSLPGPNASFTHVTGVPGGYAWITGGSFNSDNAIFLERSPDGQWTDRLADAPRHTSAWAGSILAARSPTRLATVNHGVHEFNDGQWTALPHLDQRLILSVVLTDTSVFSTTNSNVIQWRGGQPVRSVDQAGGHLWSAPDATVWAVSNLWGVSAIREGEEVQRYPLVQGTDAIWGSSAMDIWTVGVRGVSHFDGTTWTPIDLGTTESFHEVFGSSSSDVWIVGDSLWHGTRQ